MTKNVRAREPTWSAISMVAPPPADEECPFAICASFGGGLVVLIVNGGLQNLIHKFDTWHPARSNVCPSLNSAPPLRMKFEDTGGS